MLKVCSSCVMEKSISLIPLLAYREAKCNVISPAFNFYIHSFIHATLVDYYTRMAVCASALTSNMQTSLTRA